MSAFGNRHQRTGRKGQNRNPLRRVVERTTREVWVGHESNARCFERPAERLECGHVVPVKTDFVGETNAVRRRCRECGKAERAS